MGVKNLVSHTEGSRIQIEGVWEQHAEENLWPQEGGSRRRLDNSV